MSHPDLPSHVRQWGRSRSPPLHAHLRGENRAWSSFGVRMSFTTPVYITPTSWSLGSLTFENRYIAGPAGSTAPAAPAGPTGPAGPAAPATTDDDDPAATLVAASPAEQPDPASVERDRSSGCPEAAAAVGQQAATGPEAAAGPEARQGDEMRLSSLVLNCPKCKSLVIDALIPTIEQLEWKGQGLLEPAFLPSV